MFYRREYRIEIGNLGPAELEGGIEGIVRVWRDYKSVFTMICSSAPAALDLFSTLNLRHMLDV